MGNSQRGSSEAEERWREAAVLREQQLRKQLQQLQQPPVVTILDKPWRTISWRDKMDDLHFAQQYKPERKQVNHLRILLYGPVGAGKSSFINSVSNVMRGRMTTPALASATVSDKSFTKKFQTHKIRGGDNGFYSFVFADLMGLEESSDSGVHPEDIKLALKGHLKEGHKFNPLSPGAPGDTGYNETPSPDDKVHVLVCVVSANASEIKKDVLEKMKDVRKTASDLGIPQMGIITNIDTACGEIEKDLTNVYKSNHLMKKINSFSSAVGIPVNCILPVRNYSKEISLEDEMDSLILCALRLMLNFGDDFIQDMVVPSVPQPSN